MTGVYILFAAAVLATIIGVVLREKNGGASRIAFMVGGVALLAGFVVYLLMKL